MKIRSRRLPLIARTIVCSGCLAWLAPFAEEFKILKYAITPEGDLAVEFPSSETVYHALLKGTTATEIVTAVAVTLGTNGTRRFRYPLGKENNCFFRVATIPIARSKDLDGDTISDVVELNDARLNPLDPSDAAKTKRHDFASFNTAASGSALLIQAEDYTTKVDQGGKSWTIYTGTPGYLGMGAMVTTPNTEALQNAGYATNSPRIDFEINFLQTGIHYVWVRGLGPTGNDDSVHVGLDGQAIATADRIHGLTSAWGWTRETMDGPVATINVTTTGLHTLNLWMREDGAIVDALLLTTDNSFVPGRFQQDSGADGVVAMEAEDYTTKVDQGGKSWTIYTGTPGYLGTGAVVTTPNTEALQNAGYATNSPRIDFEINFLQTGIHYVWVRGLGPTGNDDSVHVGLDGQAIATADRIHELTPAWGWTRETMDGPVATINVTTTGLHTLNLWMREDGAIVDQLLLTTNPSLNPAGSPAQQSEWQNLPIYGGGFVTGLIADPEVNGLFYARTDVGGAYRWDSSFWKAITDNLPEGTDYDFGIEAMAVDPSNPGTLFIQTGMYPWPESRSKLYRSPDRGESWSRMAAPTDLEANANGANRWVGERLAVDPHNSDVIYLATVNQGLWRSIDGARTAAGWTQLTSVPKGDTTNNLGISFVICDPGGGTTVVNGRTVTAIIYAGVYNPAATGTSFGVWKSTNGGQTWSQMAGTHSTPARSAIDSVGTLYVSFRNKGNLTGWVMKASRGASSLMDISPPAQPAGVGFVAIATDPQQPGVVMVSQYDGFADAATYRSVDFGQTWSGNVSSVGNRGSAHPATRNGTWWFYNPSALVIDPNDSNRVWMGDFFGILRCDNIASGTPLWDNRVDGVEETFPLMMKSPPTGAALLTGMKDVNGVANPTVTNAPADSFVVTSTPLSFQATTDLDYCEQNPAAWIRVGSETGSGNHAYYSINGGATWRGMNAPSSDGNSRGGRVAMSATDPKNVVWIDKIGRIFWSTNAQNGTSTTWNAAIGVTINGLDVWTQELDYLTSDRVAPNTFYLFRNGGSGVGQVFRSITGGRTWSSIGGVTYDQSHANNAVAYRLLAVPSSRGELWLSIYANNSGGVIYRATAADNSSAVTFTQVPSISSSKAMIGFGAPAPGRSNATVYFFGSNGGVMALWQSIDNGSSWRSLTAAIPPLSIILEADRQVFGRLFIGTEGRGIFYNTSSE